MSYWSYGPARAMIEIRSRCWVDTAEITAVWDELDRRYAPPQRKATTVLLKSGDRLESDVKASDVIDRMMPRDAR